MTQPEEGKDEQLLSDANGRIGLRVRSWGEPGNPTLILLHGAGANSHWWDHVAPRLAPRFRIAALDFRGHGDSDYPEALQPGAFSDDLETLIQHLEAPELVIIGHSLGAHVALWHAANHPNMRALVVIDPSRGASPSRKRATRLALTMRRTYKSAEQAVQRFRFLPAAPYVEEELRRSIAWHSVREEEDQRFGFKFDPRWFGVPGRDAPDLTQIQCPTLIVRGEESNLLTAEGAGEMAAQIPDSEIAEVKTAGHHVHLDRPAAVMDRIEDFLDRRLGSS